MAGAEVVVVGSEARPEACDPSSDITSSSLRLSLSFLRRSESAVDLDLLCRLFWKASQ